MGLIVRKEHIEKILDGSKTQTRRTHKSPLRVGSVYELMGKGGWGGKWGIQIEILNVYTQKLADVTDLEGAAEGCGDFKGFRSEWIRLFGSYPYSQEVVVYEFKVVATENPGP